MSRDPNKVMAYEGLAASLLLHGALIAAILFGAFGSARPLDAKPQEAVMVDIQAISDKAQKQAQSKEATQETPKPASPVTEPVKPTPPAPKVDTKVNSPSREPKPTPPPEPEKIEQPKPEEKPLDPNEMDALIKKTEEKKPEAKKPEVKPPLKPEKPKKETKLDVDKLDRLLNKVEGEKTAPQQPTKVAGTPTKGEKEMQGDDAGLSNTIGQLLREQVYQCLQMPQAADSLGSVIQIRVAFSLNLDGSVNGQPKTLDSSNGDPILQAIMNAAISAVLSCQNYTLPKENYDLWKDNVVAIRVEP